MTEKLLNNFLLGADPELVILDPPSLVNGQKKIKTEVTDVHFFGWDHNGYVLEPHPAPSFSARTVMANIKKSLDVISHKLPSYRLRAGAYYTDPDVRTVTLGGHVHLDIPSLGMNQINAMDLFCESLEGLDILPKVECGKRSIGGAYGRKSDVRQERGRVEYRSMCSWLFSRKTSMLAVTGVKLCAVAPQTVKKMTSIPEMRNWLEGFKGADDDVDWILERGYFDSSMEARPDSNVKAVWRVDPGKVADYYKEISANTVSVPNPEVTQILSSPQLQLLLRYVMDGRSLNTSHRRLLEYTLANSVMMTRRDSARAILTQDNNRIEREATQQHPILNALYGDNNNQLTNAPWAE